MKELRIVVCEIGDPPPFPELIKTKPIHGELEYVAILEKGTQQGNTSLFLSGHPEGDSSKVVHFQITLAQLEALAGVARGADQRFKEKEKFKRN